MAIEVMSWVMHNSQAESPTEQLLLIILGNYANNDGTNCFPFLDTVAKAAKMNKTSVSKVLSRMEEKGLIKIYRVPGRGNVYHVCMPGVEQSEPDFSHLARRRKSTAVVAPSADGVSILPGTARLGSKSELDALWNAVADVCGVNIKTLTKGEQSKYGKVIKSLRLVGATPNDIRTRAFMYRRKFPNTTMTATALVNHWSSLDPKTAVTTNNVPDGWVAIQAARMERTQDAIDA